jgi:hypothetical protein
MLAYHAPVQIEPGYGFAMQHGRLIPESMPYHEAVGLPPLGCAPPRRGVQHEEAVISLREFGDTNYYHFFCDVIGKLAQLAPWSLDPAVPLLVSERLAAQPYFQAALRNGHLAGRRVLVQQGWIEAGRAIFCKAMPHSKASFELGAALLGAPPAAHGQHEKILLTRRPARGRFLANGREVAALCRAYGIRPVDTDDLSPGEQMALFAQAGLVVGIHGAGLTNLIFRRGAPACLLELFPADSIPPHYFWLCHSYGYGYRALAGSPRTQHGAFTVSLAALRGALKEVLGGQPGNW